MAKWDQSYKFKAQWLFFSQGSTWYHSLQKRSCGTNWFLKRPEGRRWSQCESTTSEVLDYRNGSPLGIHQEGSREAAQRTFRAAHVRWKSWWFASVITTSLKITVMLPKSDCHLLNKCLSVNNTCRTLNGSHAHLWSGAQIEFVWDVNSPDSKAGGGKKKSWSQ